MSVAVLLTIDAYVIGTARDCLGAKGSEEVISQRGSWDEARERRHNFCHSEADVSEHIPKMHVCSGDISGSTIVPACSPHRPQGKPILKVPKLNFSFQSKPNHCALVLFIDLPKLN